MITYWKNKKISIIGIWLVAFLLIAAIIFSSKNTKQSLPAGFSIDDKQLLVKYAYSVMDAHFLPNKKLVRQPIFFRAPSYDELYITFINKGKLRCSQRNLLREYGKGKKIFSDIFQAVVRCIGDTRYGGVLKKDEVGDIEIVFDILFNKQQVVGGIEDLKKQIELGIHALEITNGKKQAFFKSSVPISRDYGTLVKTLEKLCIKAILAPDCFTDKQTKIYRYDSITFKGDGNKQIFDLYRYNILISDVTNEKIKKSISLSRDWFLHRVNPQTKQLEYLYNAAQNSFSTDNNHVRQLGSIWSLTILQSFLQDKSLDQIIHSNLSYYMQYKKTRSGYSFLLINNESALSYNAFVILTLLNMPKYPQRDILLTQFADGIVSLQNPNGSFSNFFLSNRNDKQDYYPGEAMLALMKMYEATKDVRYLDAVTKAFPYYQDYWRNNKTTAFVSWQTQADFLLYIARKDSDVAKFIFEMNDWLIDNYQIQQSQYSDLIGGFPKNEPKNATATYLEGINDAYLLALRIDDVYHIKKYSDAIRKGTRFVLQTQYTFDNGFYLENKNQAIGGFRLSLTSSEQRIDYTQHAVMALIKTYNNNLFQK